MVPYNHEYYRIHTKKVTNISLLTIFEKTFTWETVLFFLTYKECGFLFHFIYIYIQQKWLAAKFCDIRRYTTPKKDTSSLYSYLGIHRCNMCGFPRNLEKSFPNMLIKMVDSTCVFLCEQWITGNSEAVTKCTHTTIRHIMLNWQNLWHTPDYVFKAVCVWFFVTCLPSLLIYKNWCNALCTS